IPVDQVVPVRDQVAERAALMAEGDAAVHAARPLLPQGLVVVREIDLLPVPDALGNRPGGLLRARDLDEAGRLTHWPPPPARGTPPRVPRDAPRLPPAARACSRAA